MCPELSQCVSQDHLSRAFYPESFVHDKFDQQHTFFLNHVSNRAPQYKLSDERVCGAEGSRAVTHAPQGQPVALPYAIQNEMVIALQHGQEPYPPLPPAAAAGVNAAPSDYSLHLGCSENQLMPEIDCAWMKDVLDDFLLTSHELPPLAPLTVGGVPAVITGPSLCSPFDPPSKRELQLQLPPSPSSVHSSPPSLALPKFTSTDSCRINSLITGEQLSPPALRSPAKTESSSPTPEPLKTRASKRFQRHKSARKVAKWTQKVNLVNVDQVEHVIRERQRRDDMSYKIATLESLLPQGPKRDRASIVHESVQYVKSLQQRVEELTKKYEELQQNRITKSCSGVVVIKDDLEMLPGFLQFDCESSRAITTRILPQQHHEDVRRNLFLRYCFEAAHRSISCALIIYSCVQDQVSCRIEAIEAEDLSQDTTSKFPAFAIGTVSV
ncbi:hypothetical protein R1flu_014004 [Riccia fluitans]|uniref:BHLH domain-containing protein n=1 Tax=Riccia fluitans TaxID=41844 RepID=A0ABD1YF80_9MARC